MLLLEIVFQGYKPLQDAISGQALLCYDLSQTEPKNLQWTTDIFYEPILAWLNMHSDKYLKVYQWQHS